MCGEEQELLFHFWSYPRLKESSGRPGPHELRDAAKRGTERLGVHEDIVPERRKLGDLGHLLQNPNEIATDDHDVREAIAHERDNETDFLIP